MMTADWTRIAILVFSVILNLVGFVGLFLVFFPGLTVAWVGQLIWLIFVGFNKLHGNVQFGLTIGIFALNTLIMIIGSLTDNILAAGKTRQKGVPWWEIGVTMVAMIIGGIFLTPLGGIAVSLALLYLIEYLRLENDAKKAWEATKALAFGYGIAAGIRLVLCAVMIALWVVVVVWL